MIALLGAVVAATLASGEPEVGSKPDDADKIICKRNKTPHLGSHLRARKSTCMRESAWKALEVANDEAKRRISEKTSDRQPAEGAVGVSGN